MTMPTVATPKILLVDHKWININQPINHFNTPIWTQDIYASQTDVNIFISSPGGSVVAGMDIITAIETKNVNYTTTCVAHHAYSMAFAIFQACTNRYVMQNTILMQHQMQIKVEDQYSRINTYMNMIDSLKSTLDQKQATRLGMHLRLYNQAINNDLWLFGNRIFNFNAADEQVMVICDPSMMSKTYHLTYMTNRANVDYTYAMCPLIVNPIDMKIKHRVIGLYDVDDMEVDIVDVVDVVDVVDSPHTLN